MEEGHSHQPPSAFLRAIREIRQDVLQALRQYMALACACIDVTRLQLPSRVGMN